MSMKSEFNMVYLSRDARIQQCFIKHSVIGQNKMFCNGQDLQTLIPVNVGIKTSYLWVVRGEVASFREDL